MEKNTKETDTEKYPEKLIEMSEKEFLSKSGNESPDLSFHTKIQDTKRQLVLALPAAFVRALKIKKGDIFTFRLRVNDEDIEYAIAYNEKASKLLNPGQGKEKFDESDKDVLN